MKDRKWFSKLGAAALALTFLLGAVGYAESAATQATNAIFGQVTAVDGQQITLALASMDMPQGGQPGDGQAPGNGQQPGDGKQPADGQQPGNGQQPADGQQPDANSTPTPGGNGGLTLTGETKVINVTDATVITIRNFDPNNQSNTPATGSLSDITVGSTIIVTLAEGSEDQAATIEIMPSGMGGGPNGGQAPQDASGSQA